MTMWDRFRHAWRKQGLSQRAVEAKLDMSENRISKLANDGAVLSFDELVMLVDHAGFKKWWLYDPAAPLEEPEPELSEGEQAILATVHALGLTAAEAIERLHHIGSSRDDVMIQDATTGPVAWPREERRPSSK